MKRVASRNAWVVLAAAGVLTLASCQTTQEPEVALAAEPAPAPVSQFEPMAYAAQVERAEGRYPDLFGPTSYALWVSQEVTALKREQAARSGEAIEPWLDSAALVIPASYIVIECHLESAFPDASIAYDAVGLRGMETYLELPDGRRVKPVQVLIDPHAQESPRGTLKAFTRTNLLIFTREDLLLGEPIVPATAPAVRLVLDGVGSRFFFHWDGAGGARPTGWVPTAQEAMQATQLGFRDLYGRLKTLAHMFD
jgi:hypothetical protein